MASQDDINHMQTTTPTSSNPATTHSSSSDNMTRRMREMEESLSQIEQGLDVPTNMAGGRAAFLSMSTALGNIRERLIELLTDSVATSSSAASAAASRDEMDQEQESAAAAAAAAGSTGTTNSMDAHREWERQMSERLSTAELAHSTRTPLRRLSSALGRRRNNTLLSSMSEHSSFQLRDGDNHNDNTIDNNTIHNINYSSTHQPNVQQQQQQLIHPTTATASSSSSTSFVSSLRSAAASTSASLAHIAGVSSTFPSAATVATTMTSPSLMMNEGGSATAATSASLHPDDESTVATTTRSRRVSKLLASRSRSVSSPMIVEYDHDSEHDSNHDRDLLELHERSANVRVGKSKKTMIESDHGDEVVMMEVEDAEEVGEEPSKESSEPSFVPMDTTTTKDAQTSSSMVVEEDFTPILLTESSHANLDESRRSVLFFPSESNNALSDMLVQTDLDTGAGGSGGSLHKYQNEPFEQQQQQPLHPPLVSIYSWGTGFNSLHDDIADKIWGTTTGGGGDVVVGKEEEQNEKEKNNDALVSATSRLGRATANNHANSIISVSTSASHSAVVTASGSVFVCGRNDYGQVDPWFSQTATETSTTTPNDMIVDRDGDDAAAATSPTNIIIPRPILLESILVPILQVSCGLNHTAALTSTGVVLTWGGDEYGQLGHLHRTTTTMATTTTMTNQSRFVRPQAMALSRKRAASVACGDGFTLVLTSRMEVLCCGVQPIAAGYDSSATDATTTLPSNSNNNSSRILNNASSRSQLLHPLPCTLPELEYLPIVSIAAGKRHAAVVTALGSILAWGENSHGCCGRASPKVLHVPVPIRIPCCSTTTTSGADASDSSTLPVFPGDETAVVAVACGDEHTVMVTKSGRVFVCGSNREGQLGVLPPSSGGGGTVEEYHVVHLPLNEKIVAAQAGDAHTLLLDDAGDLWILGNGKATPTHLLHGKSVVTIAAGGRHSIAIATNPSALVQQHDKDGAAVPPPRSSATASPRRELSNLLSGTGSRDQNGPESIESLVEAVEFASDNVHGRVGSVARDLAKRAEELIKMPAVLNSLFLDPQELEDLYLKLLSLGRREDRQAMVNAIEHGMTTAMRALEANTNVRLLYPESLRFLLLYIQCPLFVEWENPDVSFDRRGDLMLSICESILGLPFEGYKALLSLVTSMYRREHFVRFLVQPLLKQLEKGLDSNAGPSQHLVPLVASVLSWLHNASERAGGIANVEDFYSKAVCTMDNKDAYLDLVRWKKATKAQRSANFFMCAHPFLYSPSSKRNLLQLENQMEMFNTATAEGVTYNALEGTFEFDPFWVLEIERDQLLTQTLRKIADAKPNDLRKRLRIKFVGEEGLDAGGVTREFFQLISAQLFDVNSGMWLNRLDDEQVTWFNTDCFWNDEGYHLVGILAGLAVYNGVLLDVNFPPVVYRKLLGLPLGLEDLPDKSVQKSLQQLLDYEGDDVEDVFCLNFSLSWMDLGSERTIELRPCGSTIPVTRENKEEYVRLYVKWLLEESIHAQYDAFERGFMRIMQNSTLDFLSPEELELLVDGSPELNFSALEANTEYEGGYDCNSEVIKYFWRFVKSSDKDTQLKLLKFATGSSKAPVGGLGEMRFRIQRAGPDSMQLPTSHTCFNTLLLNEYSSYEKLAERLGRAILECEGFGLQ